jgi:hypothetical protein
MSAPQFLTPAPEPGPVIDTRRRALVGDQGTGKTLGLVYFVFDSLRRGRNSIYSYINFFAGDPFDRSNPLPIVCDGSCRACLAEETLAGHRFLHPRLVPFKFWNEIADHADGVEALDEAPTYLPSEEWEKQKSQRLIIQNARKTGLDLIITTQGTTHVSKKLRDVVLTVIKPTLNIARKPKSDGTVDETCPVDWDNEHVRKNEFDPKDNALYFEVWRETDGKWENYLTEGRWNRVEPNVIKCEVPPSVLMQYYDTNQKVSLPYEPSISQEDALKKAESLYEWFRESKSYAWDLWLRRGQEIPYRHFVPLLKKWNEYVAQSLSPRALDIVVAEFNQYCADANAGILNQKPETFKCDLCGSMFVDAYKLSRHRGSTRCLRIASGAKK